MYLLYYYPIRRYQIYTVYASQDSTQIILQDSNSSTTWTFQALTIELWNEQHSILFELLKPELDLRVRTFSERSCPWRRLSSALPACDVASNNLCAHWSLPSKTVFESSKCHLLGTKCRVRFNDLGREYTEFKRVNLSNSSSPPVNWEFLSKLDMEAELKFELSFQKSTCLSIYTVDCFITPLPPF